MSGRPISRRSFLRSGGALGLGLAAGWPRPLSAAESPTKPALLRLATFCCDVTPPEGTPIYPSYKGLATIEHPLLAKGVVLDDGAGRCVLCAVDYCELRNSTYDLFRAKLAAAAGTQPSRVAVQCVHQHTAPMADADADRLLESMDPAPPHPDPQAYHPIAQRLGATVARAVAQMKPFDQVGSGQARVERVASARRLKSEDGKILTRWSGCTDPKLVAMPEGPIDPVLRTITFARRGEPLVRLHYYAVHPQSFYGDPRASYDFPGMARERLQAREKVMQIYFTGCAGDVTAGKYNDRSPEARDGLAQRLFAGMEAASQATRYARAAPIDWRTCPLELKPRTDPGYTQEDYRARVKDADAASSSRMYQGAMGLAFLARSRHPIELTAVRLGPVDILHLPGEPMIDFQCYAQQVQPERFVAVAGYADACCGYLCTEEAFREGGYEPSASYVVPETEKSLRAAIRKLLA